MSQTAVLSNLCGESGAFCLVAGGEEEEADDPDDEAGFE